MVFPHDAARFWVGFVAERRLPGYVVAPHEAAAQKALRKRYGVPPEVAIKVQPKQYYLDARAGADRPAPATPPEGRVVRVMRELVGLGQSELAHRAGVTVCDVSALEKGGGSGYIRDDILAVFTQCGIEIETIEALSREIEKVVALKGHTPRPGTTL
jgi:hypothetical protein